MKKNLYKELTDRQEKEFAEFPMMFAFSNEQFAEGMVKLGLTAKDKDKIFSFGGGGYYKKSDSDRLKELLSRHNKEHLTAIEEDVTGLNYIADMFSYELANHEYGYTYDAEDTFNALGLTLEIINKKENLISGLSKALEEY